MRTRIRWRRGAAVLVLPAVAAVCLAPTASGAVVAAAEDERTAAAVTALTAADAPLDALPSDFDAVLGYHPAVVDGMLANPGGDCSSPVTLPAEFDSICKAHDLGYDLLRYAQHTGAPLGSWARKAIDERFDRRMAAACDARTGAVTRAGCHTMALIAGSFVDANSWRQGYATPGPEPVWRYLVAALAGIGALIGMVAFRSVALPRVETSVAVAFCVAASLAPGLLPRGPITQGLLTGMLAAAGLGLAALLRRSLGHVRARAVAAVASLGVVVAAAVAAHRWQARLRTAMGAPPVESLYWIETVAVATTVVAVLYAATASLGWTVRRLGGRRSMVVATTAGLVAWFAAVPALVDWRQAAYRTTSAFLDSAVRQPQSAFRSGSPASLAAWDTLGAEGRRFVSAGTDTASVRVYAGIDSAPDLDARVRLVLRELDRTGGFARSNVVVAVPTGSGWIDANAVMGFERRFADDVALVGVQYSYAPSWATFVFGRDEAVAAARALFDAVSDRIDTMPADSRPRLYLYGQSLGSVGGSAALEDRSGAVCAALWAGPPAGTLDMGDAAVLANSSDPVVRWSPRLVVAPPRLDRTRPDAPAPQWIPVISFIQTSVDLLGALDTPAGHGHRYGTDQGTAMPGCA